ncbi:MAG: hypothetical protein PHT87_08745, partial [Bacteroidales bacterium]|nr:hypothetical protein [Bacteroidales bacterium]
DSGSKPDFSERKDTLYFSSTQGLRAFFILQRTRSTSPVAAFSLRSSPEKLNQSPGQPGKTKPDKQINHYFL